MSSQTPSEPDKPRWTAVGVAFVVIGLLVFAPAALCTVAVMAEEPFGDALPVMLLFGGVPMVAGAALVYAGLKTRRASAAGQGVPRWTAASVAIFVLGLLIIVPSGLCTALLGVSIGTEGLPDADFSGLLIVLLYGGVPMALGGALVYAGLKSRRRD